MKSFAGAKDEIPSHRSGMIYRHCMPLNNNFALRGFFGTQATFFIISRAAFSLQ
jgi:hypothetical protein